MNVQILRYPMITQRLAYGGGVNGPTEPGGGNWPETGNVNTGSPFDNGTVTGSPNSIVSVADNTPKVTDPNYRNGDQIPALPPISVGHINGLGSGAEQAQRDALTGHSNSMADRYQQQAYINSLYGKLGSRTSDSATMLGQMQDRNSQNLASALAARRGLNSGSATRMALWQNGQGNQQTAQMAQQSKIQEDAINRQLLAQALNAKRQFDIAQQTADTSLFGTGGNLYGSQRGQDIGIQQQSREDMLRAWAASKGFKLQEDAANSQAAGSAASAAAAAIPVIMAAASDGGEIPDPMAMGYADGGHVTGGSRDNPTDFALDMNLPPRLIREAMARAMMHARPGAESDITGGARDAYEHEMRPGRSSGDMAYASGGMTTVPPMVDGGHVPGRAKVRGDNPKNDTVLTRLSPGEGVIPRSIMKSPNAPSLAASFVEEMKQSHAKSGATEKNGSGDHAPLLARANKIKQHLKKINALLEAT